MHVYYNLLLFAITFIGGSIPLWVKGLSDKRMHYLLAFSGSFLLSITFLHLVPETFEELGSEAGLLLLAGFFVQLIIQRITHGVEHGHVHVNPAQDHNHHNIPLKSVLVGLTLHAFMEGLPLGFQYRMHGTEPSLYMAVAAHKLPEAMLVASLLTGEKNKMRSLAILMAFSAVTPLGGILATVLGSSYGAVATAVTALIPVVAGAFIHIATTIFFESGTKQHLLTRQKIFAIILGVGIGLATLMFE